MSLRAFGILPAFFLVLAASCVSRGAAAQSPDPETERREAAAGFVLPMVMSLGSLRLECRYWLHGSADDVDTVAHAWWQRNREDLDAASWITGEAVRRYRSTMTTERAQQAERQLLQVISDSHLAILRTSFNRQLPDADSCRRALQQYKASQLDIARLGAAPGYERFAEFGQTLKRAREDRGYRPPAEAKRTFDAQVGVVSQPLITLDFIEAAKQKKDSKSVMQGFESLAERGDRRAAQTLGSYYLSGQYAAPDAQAAQAWFYNAWAMGEPEGINALGVMARDGVGMAADRPLALAAFALARQLATDRQEQAQQRSSANYARLAGQMAAQDIAAAGCLTRQAVHDRFRQLAEKAGGIRLHTALAPTSAAPLGNETLFESKAMEPAAGVSCRN
jgi:TPR repeat protein